MQLRNIGGRSFASLTSLLYATLASATPSDQSPASLGEPIVVTAARQVQRTNEVLTDVSVISEDEIRSFGPAVTINDILARQPGVEVNSKGGLGTDSSVFLRGSNTTHALVLIDGIRFGSNTLGYASWGYIPVEQIDHIEILRGPGSSLYGADAIGGVIQIFTKRADAGHAAYVEVGRGTWNTSTLNAGISASHDGWHVNFQAAKKEGDSYSAINNPRNTAYNPDNDGYATTSSSGSVSFSNKPGNEVGISFMYAQGWNRYDYSVSKSKDWRQDETVYGVNLYAKKQITSKWASTIRAGKSSDQSNQNADGVVQSQIESSQTQYQWQNDIVLPIGTGLLALERNEQSVSGTVAYELNRRSVDSYLVGWTGTQGRHQGQFSARSDRNSQYGNQNTGAIAYGYQVTPQWRMNGSASTGFKAPSFNDMYWPGAGNPDLKPETSSNREIALKYENQGTSASLTYYSNNVKNLIEWAPIAAGSSTWIPSNVASAELKGWTLSYATEVANWRIASSLDLQNPQDTRTQNILRYRAREIGRLAVAHEFGRLSVGADVLASGLRYNDAANTQQLSPYELVSIFAKYRIERDWTVLARINNLFNREYVLVQDYETPRFNFFIGLRYSPK